MNNRMGFNKMNMRTYSVLFFISIILIAFSIFIRMNCCLNTFFMNLGCGLLASGIIALIVEKLSKQQKIEIDIKIKEYILGAVKEECINLTSEMYTSVYESIGYNDEKYSFYEWTNLLFNDYKNDKQKSEILYMLQTIDEIETKANKAKNLMEHSLDNSQISIEDFDKIKKLIIACKKINYEVKRENFERCKSVITNDLIFAIEELFPEIKSYFTRKYNYEDFE